MGTLQGLTALITGGGSGIGLATAKALVREGAVVCITGRNLDRLQEAKSALQALGGDVHAHALDVTEREACQLLVADLCARWGHIDALVNNAGIYKAAPFLEYDPRDFEALFRTNVTGCVNLMQAALPGMLARQTGSIVNIASTAGKWGSVNQSAYNASKHALVGLTRCVALEVARRGVTVNAVCPGLVDTEMAEHLFDDHARMLGVTREAMSSEVKARIPIGRMISPDEIGSTVAWLVSPACKGMTGQSIVYDGGMLLI